MLLYNATGGQHWVYPDEDDDQQRRWDLDSSENCTIDNQLMPVHCCWAGVCCCSEKGFCQLALLQLPLDRGEYNQNNTAIEDIQLQEDCKQFSVRSISLLGMNLAGTIPDQAWSDKLPNLDLFFASRNNISGTIPQSFFNLTNLRILALDRNYLTGSLPDVITQMSKLQALSLQSNGLSGSIPQGLFQMRDLNLVYLGFNQLNGTIPNLVRKYNIPSNITSLELQNNRLTGHFPIALDLDSQAAAVYGTYQLTYLNIRSNELDGTLPDALGTAMPKLVEFDAGENYFTGTLPESFGYMYSLRRLLLDFNQFNGRLPSFGESPVLRDLFLQNNSFTGTIPPQLLKLGIEQLDLNQNDFEGVIPIYTGSNLLFRLFNVGQNPKLSAYDLEGQQIQNNKCYEPLPRFLKFQVSTVLVSQPPLLQQEDAESQEIMCPLVLLDTTEEGDGVICRSGSTDMTGTTQREDYSRVVTISPRYYGYRDCDCPEGLVKAWVDNPEIPFGKDMICRKPPHSNNGSGWNVALYVVVIVVIFFIGFTCASWRFRARLQENILLMRKRNGPPNAGNFATVVVTDIEGSTALMEHHSYAMSAAQTVHDSLMRRIRWQHAGYESITEGDSFTIVFHEAMDAAAFCLQVQQALLAVDWNEELLDNEHATEVLAEVAKSLSVFDNGGSSRSLQAGPSGKRRRRRLSIGDQIVNFAEQLRVFQHRKPGTMTNHPLEAIKESTGSNQGDLEMAEVGSNSTRSWYEESVAELNLNQSTRGSMQEGKPLFRGLRVRMAVATGLITQRSLNRLTGRVEIQGPVMDKVNALADIPQGGQIIMDFDTFQAVNGRLDELGTVDKDGYNHKRLPSAIVRRRRRKISANSRHAFNGLRSLSASVSLNSIRRSDRSAADKTKDRDNREQAKGVFYNCMHFCRIKVLGIVNDDDEEELENITDHPQAKVVSLGGFKLKRLDDGQSVIRLVEIYPHRLLQRSIQFREKVLQAEGRVQPSFYEAPGAFEIRLGAYNPAVRMPQVVLGFCAVESVKSLQFLSSDKELGDQFYNQLIQIIESCLRMTRGYLCQDNIDTFMLAFFNTRDAVQFSLLVQERVLKHVWMDKITKQEGFRKEYSREGTLLFNGPRLKVGLYEGIPTQIMPHTTTGRADYFGPLVNRAARFCHAGAHGGQIVLTRQMMQSVLTDWNIQNVSLESLCKIKQQMAAENMELQQPVITRVFNEADLQANDHNNVLVDSFDDNQIGHSNSSRSSEITTGHIQLQDDTHQSHELVEIHDMGSYEFRGCDGQYQLVYLVEERLSGRRFPYGLAKPKGKCVKQGVGLLCKVRAPLYFEEWLE